MFNKIMAIVVVVILLVTIGQSMFSLMSIRNLRIADALENLTMEAREIAYLASETRLHRFPFGQSSNSLDYLEQKAETIQERYDAYILVVDRSGRVMDNMNAAYRTDPDFVASLNMEEITEALGKVLTGTEISVRVNVNGAPTFTVGVPFVQDEKVLGAVLIRTAAQTVEGGAGEYMLSVLWLAIAAAVIAGVSILVLVRRTFRPLKALNEAAKAMARGSFKVRVPQDAETGEIAELSRTFNAMADQLSKVEESRREFVANVSHELRSPITSIAGFVQGMEDGTIPPEEHSRYLAIVNNETKRLTRLIGDLLALSRLERDDAVLERKRFDMNELLRRVIIRRVNDLEEKQMEMECDFRTDPCMVCADSDRIEQVIVNLLDNALKFTPEHGRIQMDTELVNGRCIIHVTDNGCGVLPDDKPRIFERFFTADRAHTSGKGTGLGLSICQRIMEMHGGSIRLLDTAEGASFEVIIPETANEDGGKTA